MYIHRGGITYCTDQPWEKTNKEETVDVMVECETRLYSDLLMLEE